MDVKFNGKWLPEKQSYKDACLRLSKDLRGFKQDQDYIPFIGNDTRGKDVVKEFDEVVNLPYVSKNDRIGKPVLYRDKSAGTLRFMKVYQDIKELCDFKNVVEVGAGYGGQCLVVSELHDVNYTIIDIPESLALSKAYLAANGVECKFISSENVPKLKTDLLISDYCLSEFDADGVEFYLNKIDFKFGYFTINGNLELIIESLRKRNYKLKVRNEIPRTSHHSNYILTAEKL